MAEASIILQNLTTEDLFTAIRAIVREESAAANGQQSNAEDDALITRVEAAELLKVTLPTLDKYIREGKLAGYRIGRRVRLKRREVAKALSAMSRSPLRVA